MSKPAGKRRPRPTTKGGSVVDKDNAATAQQRADRLALLDKMKEKTQAPPPAE